MLMMLAVFVWSLGYTFEIGAAGLGAKMFWAKIEYLGIVTVPFVWLVFALRYACWDSVFTRRNLALLAAVPLDTLLLVATNGAHGLIWSRTAPLPFWQVSRPRLGRRVLGLLGLLVHAGGPRDLLSEGAVGRGATVYFTLSSGIGSRVS